MGMALPCATQSDAHDHAHKADITAEQIGGRRIPDVRLTDQNGHQVRFLSDVLRQRTALVSFIYTSCTTTCPLVGATMAAVAEHFQKDSPNLAIISVSVDPDYDTPARLLTWRERYGDIPQWTLLTGPKREIEQLLRALGAYSANLEDHSDILLVGPDVAGKWTRMSSLAAWDKVAAAVRAASARVGK
jgi:protein SCO1/2